MDSNSIVQTGSTQASDSISAQIKLRDSCDGCARSKVGTSTDIKILPLTESEQVKCGREKPICRRCRRRGTPCIYVESKRIGKPKPASTDDSEDTVMGAQYDQSGMMSPVSSAFPTTPWSLEEINAFSGMEDWFDVWEDLPQSGSTDGTAAWSLEKDPFPSPEVPASTTTQQSTSALDFAPMPSSYNTVPSSQPAQRLPSKPRTPPERYSAPVAQMVPPNVANTMKEHKPADKFEDIFETLALLFSEKDQRRNSWQTPFDAIVESTSLKDGLSSNHAIADSLSTTLQKSSQESEDLLHFIILGVFKILARYESISKSIQTERRRAPYALSNSKRPESMDIFSELACSFTSPTPARTSQPINQTDNQKAVLAVLGELPHIQGLIDVIACHAKSNYRRSHGVNWPRASTGIAAGASRMKGTSMLVELAYERLVPDLKAYLSSISGDLIARLSI